MFLLSLGYFAGLEAAPEGFRRPLRSREAFLLEPLGDEPVGAADISAWLGHADWFSHDFPAPSVSFARLRQAAGTVIRRMD